MNIVEHVSLLHVGASSGYMPRRGIPGSSDSPLSNFLRNCQTDFQSGCTSLHFTSNGGVFLFLHILTSICCHLSFFILAILIGVRLNLKVVLICISLMTKDVKHFFRCFSAIWYSSVENYFLVLYPIF